MSTNTNYLEIELSFVKGLTKVDFFFQVFVIQLGKIYTPYSLSNSLQLLKKALFLRRRRRIKVFNKKYFNRKLLHLNELPVKPFSMVHHCKDAFVLAE